jgi:hypothetical protein
MAQLRTFQNGVPVERHLDWEGCRNARDLGGLPAAGGRRTRWGAVVRSDDPARLTAAGWAALRGHGIRTIVDVRNDERDPTRPPPADQGPAPAGGSAPGPASSCYPLTDPAVRPRTK